MATKGERIVGIPIGDGYEVDPDTARRYVQHLHDGVKVLSEILQNAEQAGQVRPPGNDAASKYIAAATKAVMDLHREANLKMQKDLQGLADAIQASLTSYQETESHSAMRS